ncbi:unnamed protein product [Spirodela intermedia]|uniref:CWF21 domain-containing protein n=1 Tax=Spirodela intermedia TaxID=51605 RepID=A0A7I8JN35_SPIIN|nr:unnamed protein product [Spirodela intermedia]CAA6671221.1 unnamed protein product [Spirodela intermedia]
MYNGIGLQTPRGSGTNGYIQTNKFFVRPRPGGTAVASGIPRPGREGPEDGIGGGIKKANKDIIDHDRKRRIQLRLLVLEETLVDQGYTASEIAERLAEAKETYEAEASAAATGGRDSTDGKRFSDTQTHQVALRKEKQSELFRTALKLTRDQQPEPDIPQQRSHEKAEELGREDSDYEEGEYERGFKGSGKQLARDGDGLSCKDRENDQRKKAPAEDPIRKKVKSTEAEVGTKKNDVKKSTHQKMKHGKSREYSDSDTDSRRGKGRKMKKGNRKNSDDDISDDDSDILTSKKIKRKYDSGSLDSGGSSDDKNRKKETRNHHRKRARAGSDSDSERGTRGKKPSEKHRKKARAGSDSDSERGTRGKKPSDKRRKRQRDDSNSDSERDPMGEKQYGKHKRRHMHDPEDSESDYEKKNKEMLARKHAGERKRRQGHDPEEYVSDDEKNNNKVLPGKHVEKQRSRRRHDSDISESDNDKKMRSMNLRTDRKTIGRKSKGERHDSQESHSDGDDEKKRRNSLVVGRNGRRAIKDIEELDGDAGGNRKIFKSRVAEFVKTKSSSTEDSGSDSSSSESSSDSDRRSEFEDKYSRRHKREDGPRKEASSVVKKHQIDLVERRTTSGSIRKNGPERHDRINNDDDQRDGTMDAMRGIEKAERYESKRDFDDDDFVTQEPRRRRTHDDDHGFDKPSNLRSVIVDVSEGRKQKETRGEGTSEQREYESKRREDRAHGDYSRSNMVDEKLELEERGGKQEVGSVDPDRDSRGADLSRRRRVSDHSQYQRAERYEPSKADGDGENPSHSQRRREEVYERSRGAEKDYDRGNVNASRDQRRERYQSGDDSDGDRYKYRRSQNPREERREHRDDRDRRRH